MSFLSGLPQLASILAQPAVLAAGVATGVAVGAVGVGTGVIPVTDPGPRLTPVYECPGSGRVLTSLEPDQKVLVTARNADGTWLELYIGQPGAERAWAPAKALQLRAAPDSLPVDDCTSTATAAPLPTTLEPPSVGPTESAAPTGVPASVAPSAVATPRPTRTPKPTPAPTPSPTPYLGPVISNLTIYYPYTPDPGTGHYFVYPPSGGCSANTAIDFQVDVDDTLGGNPGVDTVTLSWATNGGPSGTMTLSHEGGTLYENTLGVGNDWPVGIVTYSVTATDLDGITSPVFHSSPTYVLEMRSC